jgi:hypothetical protein
MLGGSWGTIKQIMRVEGVRGFYKGLSASYLGVTETTIQWVLYEQLKYLSADTQGRGGAMEWLGMLGSAGTAKFVASLITYPHEVRPRASGISFDSDFFIGSSDATAATLCEWEAEVYRVGADAASSSR